MTTRLFSPTGNGWLPVETTSGGKGANGIIKISSSNLPCRAYIGPWLFTHRKGPDMPRRYTISEERRKELSEQRAAVNRTPEMKAARSAYMAEFNKTPEMCEASSERHKRPGYTANLLAARWPKSHPK